MRNPPSIIKVRVSTLIILMSIRRNQGQKEGPEHEACLAAEKVSKSHWMKKVKGFGYCPSDIGNSCWNIILAWQCFSFRKEIKKPPFLNLILSTVCCTHNITIYEHFLTNAPASFPRLMKGEARK